MEAVQKNLTKASTRLHGRRIPAFGEWNHRYADDAAVVDMDDDWAELSERFNCAMRAPLTAYQRTKTVKARTMRRRRRIPAFGEWNTTDCYHGGSSGREWPAAITPCFEFELAKPWIPPCTAEVTAMRSSGAVVGKQQRKGEARQGRRIRRVPDVGPNAGSKVYYISVVDDDDLYEITPSMLPHKSMEKGGVSWIRGLLMACFRGSNCTD